jgi:hypothetical protein
MRRPRLVPLPGYIPGPCGAAVLAVLASLTLAAPAAGQAPARTDSVAPRLEPPPSLTQPPPGFRLSALEARRIADRTAAVRSQRAKHGRLRATVWISGPGRWEVDYYARKRNVVQVDVHGLTGEVLVTYSGLQAESYLARGHLGRKADSPWVWAVLCVAFVLPFFDPRRPLRLLHLDLLVLLGFGVSHAFFTQGDVAVSVPLVYPVLAYLLIRMLAAGFRPRERHGPLVPLAPIALLAVGLVALVALRVGLNLANDKVIDVGYASVVGADRITHGEELYVDNDIHGDTYGPVTYLAYVPFEQLLPASGRWDSVPAAHAAAIAFDLVTLLGLFMLGGRLRAGPEGRRLGLALAFAWAAYPYTMYALATNTNDGLVAALLVLTLLAASSPAARGALLGLAAAAKFAPVALAPLFLRGPGESWRRSALFAAALVGIVAFAVLLYLPDGGPREFYDTTIGYQLGRYSPFSLWGLHPGLAWLASLLKVAAVGLAVAVAFVPRQRDPARLAALGAAVLIATEIPVAHWFYFYVVWFAPFVLVGLFAEYRSIRPGSPTLGA